MSSNAGHDPETTPPIDVGAMSPDEWVSFAENPALGLSALHARFVSHAFERHSHDYYVMGTVEAGAPAVALDRHEIIVPPGHAMLINPGKAHDGRSFDRKGYIYRMIYVEPAAIRWALEDEGNGAFQMPEFRDPTLDDLEAVGRLRRLHRAILARADGLTCETLLLDVMDWLVPRHAAKPSPIPHVGKGDPRIAKARDLLRDRYDEPLTTTDLAEATGLGRSRLNRLFQEVYGLPPHAYLNRVRLQAARAMLSQGMAAAEVAVAVGLADQSHLIRRFRGSFGISPGQFVAGRHTVGQDGKGLASRVTR